MSSKKRGVYKVKPSNIDKLKTFIIQLKKTDNGLLLQSKQ